MLLFNTATVAAGADMPMAVEEQAMQAAAQAQRGRPGSYGLGGNELR